MKPWLHSLVSVKKFGGIPEDYIEIHNFIDSSKATHASMKHRAILHSSFGCYVTERVFGINIKNSNGKLVSVRDIAEQHIIDDMGKIPSVDDYLNGMPFYDWLGGPKKTKTFIPFEEPEKVTTIREANENWAPSNPKEFEETKDIRTTAEKMKEKMLKRPFDPTTAVID